MSDLAVTLAGEAEAWLQNLRGRGLIPRGFIGITADDRKFVLQLVDSRLDHTNKLQFFRWLCRSKHVVAYAYVTHVARLNNQDDPDSAEEAVDIYASSATRDVAIVLTIERHGDGSTAYKRDHASSRQASDNPGFIFLGLQRSTATTDVAEVATFEKIWDDLGPAVTWLEKKRPHWITFALGPSMAIPGLKEHFEHYQDCWNRGEFDSNGNLVLDEKAKIWESYDKSTARDAFIGKEKPSRFESIVSDVLRTKFRLRDRYVPSLFEATVSAVLETEFRLGDAFLSTSKIRDKWVTTVTIHADRIICRPAVQWPPSEPTFKAIVATISYIEGREWIEYYMPGERSEWSMPGEAR